MTVLESGLLRLRPPQDGDVAARLLLGNRRDIQKMFGADPADFRELTPEGAEAWVSTLKAERYGWVIEYDGQLVGSIRLHSVNPMDRRAALAVGILSPETLGKGVGTEAMRLLAGHAFGEMGLNRISVRVLDFNERAIAAYKKVGFQIEGREREAAFISGQWHDDLMMGLLAREFEVAAP